MDVTIRMTIPRKPSVWENVPARYPGKGSVWENVPARSAAQGSNDSVLDTITGKIGKIAESGISGGVKSYLDTKGDARVAQLVSTVQLVSVFAGGALVLYLLSQSGKRK